MGELTHFNQEGEAHMVDVGAKAQTHRIARATGVIRMAPATFALVKSGTAKKGDVISCPIGVKHFHGATNTSSGAHIALTGEKEGKNVEWLELVSNEEYENALKEARE